MAALSSPKRPPRSGLDGLDLSRIRPDAFLFPNDRRNALRAVYAAGDRAGLNGVGGAEKMMAPPRSYASSYLRT